MTDLSVLNPDQIAEYQPRLQSIIEAVAAHSSGRYTAQNIFDFARKGAWQIWLIHEGEEIVFIGGTEVVTFPSGMTGFVIRFGSGSGFKNWLHHMETVLDWGKLQGATLCEGAFRIGWRRVLRGWTHSHDLLERRL